MKRAMAIGALVALGGCRVFDEALLDASSDAGSPDAMDARCPLRVPPPRPAIEDGDDTAEIAFAVRRVDIDQGEGWRSTGYDLDGLCTDSVDAPVECLPPARMGTPEVDGVGGIDNSMGNHVFPILLITAPDLELQSQWSQELGLGALFVRIRGWNGQDDDPVVEVDISQSVYGTPGLADGGVPDGAIPDGGLEYPEEPAFDDAGHIAYDDGGVPPFPRWEGNDYFWCRDDSFLAGNPESPKIRDDAAYVRDRVVVMRIPDRADIVFSAFDQSRGYARGTLVRLTDATLTLTMLEDGQTATVIVAGRFAINDILDSAVAAGFCAGSDDYAFVVNVLNLSADVRSIPGTGGPRVLCDAVSVAFSFEGTRAHFAGVVPGGGLPAPCEE